MSEGAQRIVKERKRQINQEGWDAYHDDEHDGEEIAYAAACYAMPVATYVRWRQSWNRRLAFREAWPWGSEWDKRIPRLLEWKPPNPDQIEDRIRELAKAGALCAAEIDRLLRLKEELETQG